MITIKYSCKSCGMVDAECQVPARDTAEDDLKEWMERTLHFVIQDHRSTHPGCRAKILANIKFPLKGADGTEAEFMGQQLE